MVSVWNNQMIVGINVTMENLACVVPEVKLIWKSNEGGLLSLSIVTGLLIWLSVPKCLAWFENSIYVHISFHQFLLQENTMRVRQQLWSLGLEQSLFAFINVMLKTDLLLSFSWKSDCPILYRSQSVNSP